MNGGGRRGWRVAAAFCILLGGSSRLFALSPALDVSQYAHTAWRISEGFTRGVIHSIAQTPDGYLWFGTEFGLFRFDGVRQVQWQPPPDQHLPSSFILRLLAGRDGTLWIGAIGGLASWKDGKLVHYGELAGVPISALIEDREGSVWTSGRFATGKFCAIRKGSVQCYGRDSGIEEGPAGLFEDSKGKLWVAVRNGVWRWKPGPPKFYALPAAVDGYRNLAEGDDGALLIASYQRIFRLLDGKAETYWPPGAGGQFRPYALLRDRDGALWIGTDKGLVHVQRERTDVFAKTDGLTGDRVGRLFEDREGNIWAATVEGLDRFRDFAVTTFSQNHGLSDASVTSVLADKNGGVWIGTSDGLNRWMNGQKTVYRKRRVRPITRPAGRPLFREIYDEDLPDSSMMSLSQDERGRVWVSASRGIAYFEEGRFVPVSLAPAGNVHSIAEESPGNVWINDQERLSHLVDGRLVEQILWAKLGRTDFPTVLVPDRANGGLWLGFLRGGLGFFKDGKIRASYSSEAGIGEGRVGYLRVDPDGTVWAATEGGLSRLKDGRAATLTSNNGLPCDAVHWVMEDDDHSVWLNMACGLVRVARSELDAWAAAADKSGRTIQATLFDSSDGVRSRGVAAGYAPAVAKSGDGRLWFVTADGIAVVDPGHLPFNKLLPPVHIEQIIADRKRFDADGDVRLPALTRDLEIDYTALSLAAPEKVKFRYKLEGHDPDWQDVGTRRQAFYNDLPPRQYHFRVIACNNSGVWNKDGASLDFAIAPAYYQTTWFLALVVAAVLALIVAVYQLRLRYLKHEFNIRLEARVGERTRIARDLHDTLLQSFQGVLLKFSSVKYVMRNRPDEAEETLERIVDQARAAINEGRDAVQGMRSSTVVANDLARAISTFGKDLAADQSGRPCPEFGVEVEGKSRDLPPLVRDEVYHIACESLRNAFRHAQAKRIEVEIQYDRRQFRLRVVDNGKGIDPAVLSAGGRAGHHGLPGIHERAKLAGGKLSVWSRLDSGTEIELTIPRSIAYAKSSPARRSISAEKETGS